MSLPILVAVVAVGIAAIVLAIHWTGGSRGAVLDDEDHARRRFAVDHPSLEASAVVLTADGRSAFLRLGRSQVGLVHAVGRHFLTRLIVGREILSIARPNDSSLVVRIADFTFPGATWRFASAADAAAAHAMLEGLPNMRVAA